MVLVRPIIGVFFPINRNIEASRDSPLFRRVFTFLSRVIGWLFTYSTWFDWSEIIFFQRELKATNFQTSSNYYIYLFQSESFPDNLTKLDIRHSSGHTTAFRLISLCLHSLQCLGLSDPFFESFPSSQELRPVFASLQAVAILEFSYCSLLTDQIVLYIAANCR